MVPNGEMVLRFLQETLVKFAASVAANSLLGGLAARAGRRFTPILGRRDPRTIVAWFFALLFLWTAVNLFVFYRVRTWWVVGVLFVLTSSPLFFVPAFLWNQLDQFWSVGLRGADRQIRTGLDYHQALRLVKNQLAFLGTGAAKLTDDPEFEQALLRCRPDRPVRFLLINPTGENLIDAARRAGKPENEYRQIVLASLERIARMKRLRGVNIEVRFYDRIRVDDKTLIIRPVFRVMFIDNAVCLVSYNVFGEGDGSQLPQLHLAKGSEPDRVVHSFCYPFELYFDWLWDISEPWDFCSYLEQDEHVH